MNPFFAKSNYLRCEIEFESSGFIEPDDISCIVKAVIEASVARFLKGLKSITHDELLTSTYELSGDEHSKALERPRDKEFIDITVVLIKYCPWMLCEYQ